MKPILFSTDMVKSLLACRKTQTRRVIKPQPTKPRYNTIGWLGWEDGHGYKIKPQPFSAGDILYVRETWAHIPETTPGNMHYKASATNADLDWFKENGWKWRPSIHMPREAARIFLRVTGVMAERVQDITLSDIESEGFYCDPEYSDPTSILHHAYPMRMKIHFAKYWNALNAERGYSWESNPWVWVYEFESIGKPEG